MLGIGKKRKEKEVKEIPKPNQDEGIKTATVDAEIFNQDKAKVIDWLITEYKDLYAGLFNEKDIEQLDSEATTLTLLFAIYGELRIIRKLKEKGIHA